MDFSSREFGLLGQSTELAINDPGSSLNFDTFAGILGKLVIKIAFFLFESFVGFLLGIWILI